MIDNGDEVILTKAEYVRYVKAVEWLDCLEAAGIDNWEGIDIAYGMLDEGDE